MRSPFGQQSLKKKHPKWLVVNNMKPVSAANPRLWIYGADKAFKQCKYDQIRHIIPAPALHGTSSGRTQNQYKVELISKYWST